MPLPPGQPERREGKADAAIANSDKLAHLIKVVWIILAIYVALAVTVASAVGIYNSIRSVDLSRKGAQSAKDGARYAEDGARYAEQALAQAKINEGIANDVKELVAQSKPCYEGDPPDSPACERQARSDKIVAEAIANIKLGIDTHDINSDSAHAELMKRRGIAPLKRTPITSPPQSSTPTRTTTTSPTATTTRPLPPATTTTTCPKRGKSGNCHK